MSAGPAGRGAGVASYEVIVDGVLAPAFLTAARVAGARHALVTSVFTVRMPDGRDLLDVAATLAGLGLEILDIRRLDGSGGALIPAG